MYKLLVREKWWTKFFQRLWRVRQTTVKFYSEAPAFTKARKSKSINNNMNGWHQSLNTKIWSSVEKYGSTQQPLRRNRCRGDARAGLRPERPLLRPRAQELIQIFKDELVETIIFPKAQPCQRDKNYVHVSQPKLNRTRSSPIDNVLVQTVKIKKERQNFLF